MVSHSLQHYHCVIFLEQVLFQQLAALTPLLLLSQECFLLYLKWWLQVQAINVCV